MAVLTAPPDTVRARPGSPLTIGVVADTHSRPHAGALGHLRALAPDAILHGGDIGDEAVIEELRGIAPVLAVRGNIDGRGLPDVRTIDLVGAKAGSLRILLTHVALRGPKLVPDIARRATEAGAQLVVCGHSHVPFLGRDRGFAVFNPGSIGPRRFALPILYGVLRVGDRVELAHHDAETGLPWTPPVR